MAKKQHTEAPPVDAEDDDRRLAPQADVQPTEPSAQQDEHRGLAARILDLRKLIETNRVLHVKEYAQQQQRIAQLEQLVSAMATRIDSEVEAIQKRQRDLQTTLHEGGEQVRQAGQIARKIQDGMKELEELRAVASDPHEVVKPLLRSIAQLRADLERVDKSIDIRFEQMPRPRAQAYEARGDDEDPVAKLSDQVRALSQRLRVIEKQAN